VTVQEAIAELARSGRIFTSDDVYPLIDIPDPEHRPNGKNNQIGMAFRHAHRLGVIRPIIGVRQSTQPSRKGGMVRQWIGTL
jgi:hypothetical protein